MRLAILSDIHGNLIAFEAALADMESQGSFDYIFILGDLAAFGTRPAECVQRVRQMIEARDEKQVRVIGGNTDRYLVNGERMKIPPAKDEAGFQRRIASYSERDQVLNWNMAQLSWEDYEFLAKINGREIYHHIPDFGAVLGFHAVPGDDEGMALRPDSSEEEARDSLLDREGRIALTGHTHVQVDRDLSPWRVINPGSIGMSFSQPGRAEWAVLIIENGKAQVDMRSPAYDIEAAIADAHAVGYPVPSMIAERLRQNS